jgi:hypothetical protein
VKLPGAARAAMSLTKAQNNVFVESLGRFRGEVTNEVVQRIATAVRKADAATTMIVDNGDGTLTAVRPLGRRRTRSMMWRQGVRRVGVRQRRLRHMRMRMR